MEVQEKERELLPSLPSLLKSGSIENELLAT